jgi:hypothetical protein
MRTAARRTSGRTVVRSRAGGAMRTIIIRTLP